MTTPKELVLIGGGEHARVIAEAAQASPQHWKLAGFVDSGLTREAEERLGVRGFARDEEAMELAGSVWYILGIARFNSAGLRRKLVSRYTAAGARWATVVHPRAWISPTAQLGPGSFVGAGAVLQTASRVGAHVVVNTSAVVEHDVQVGDYTALTPGVVVGGGTIIGVDAYLGLGCRIRDHVQLGNRVVVGMGAVVVRSVEDDTTVVGVPAAKRES